LHTFISLNTRVTYGETYGVIFKGKIFQNEIKMAILWKKSRRL